MTASKAQLRAHLAEAEKHRALFEQEPSPVDGLRLRRVMHDLTRTDFLVARRYFTGWQLDSRAGNRANGRPTADTRALVTVAPYEDDDVQWVHASISHPDRMPTYAELAALHAAVYDGYAYQVFAPDSDHVNIHPWALHLWGRLDGERVLPDFGHLGTI